MRYPMLSNIVLLKSGHVLEIAIRRKRLMGTMRRAWGIPERALLEIANRTTRYCVYICNSYVYKSPMQMFSCTLHFISFCWLYHHFGGRYTWNGLLVDIICIEFCSGGIHVHVASSCSVWCDQAWLLDPSCWSMWDCRHVPLGPWRKGSWMWRDAQKISSRCSQNRAGLHCTF